MRMMEQERSCSWIEALIGGTSLQLERWTCSDRGVKNSEKRQGWEDRGNNFSTFDGLEILKR